MSAPGLHHRKPHLVSSELPGKALTNGRRSACVVLCWPDGHWNPPSPNSSYHVKTIAPAAPPPTTTVHSTCAPSLQPPKATAPSFSLQTGRHRHYTNAFSYTCYTPPERGSAAPGRSPYNPGAGQDARGMPGGPSVVTEGYRRWPWLPPTLGLKTGGPPGH